MSGILLASAGAFAFAGALFTALHLRRPSSEHRLVAALAAACATSTALPFLIAGTDAAWVAELVAFGLVAQLGLRSAPNHGPARLARTIQVVLAVAGGLMFFGGSGSRAGWALGAAGGAAASCLLIGSAARGYVAGRRELGGVIFGAAVLFLSVANDGLRVTSGHFASLGFLSLLSGLGAKLAVEHADVRRRLDERKRELRSRTRELRHSHHELLAAQAELSTKEQLAAVGELAAVVAHEVRNPLAILGNAVSSLRKPNLAADDRATLLEIIDSEATRLNRIVTDLLSFSRPITVQRGTIDLGELIERATSLAARRSDVTIDLQMLTPGVRVWADGNLLRQVFDNLIDNALQAMDAGGTLTVRVHAVARSAEDPRGRRGDAVKIDIVDTGEGMDTAVRRRAKDPFFTTRPSGTGLGLAIVDRIVDAHGGRVEIDSQAGQGTKVTVHLPAASSEPPSGRASYPEEEALARGSSRG